MKKLRLGIIGLGSVSELHVKAYKTVDEIELVCGADINEKRLEFFAENYQLKTYTDYMEMLDKENLDIVCILVPAKLHMKIVRDIAKCKVNILCEKPLTGTLDEAEEMKMICEQEKVRLFYGASYRFLPACIEAKKLIEKNAVGDIMFMSEQVLGGTGYENYRDLGNSHYGIGQPGGGGLGLVDHGIHFVDLFKWYTKEEIDTVYGRGNYSGHAPVTEHLTMTFKNGAVAQLIYNEATFPTNMPSEGIFSEGVGYDYDGSELLPGTWHPFSVNISIYGKEGSLRIFPYANKLYVNNKQGMQEIKLISGQPSPAQFALQMKTFAEDIQQNREASVSIDDGYWALKTILAAYKSFENQQIVKL